MKATTFFLFLSMSALLVGDYQPVEAVNMNTQKSVSNTRTYKKISSLLNSVERDLRRDLSSLNQRHNIDTRTHNKYKSEVAKYAKSVVTMKRHLANAKRSYARYNKEYNRKVNENRQLLLSLNRQRAFIKNELKYIDHMERESLNLKRYSSRYVAIRKEIRQMRVQVQKEIRDVINAYNLARSRIGTDQNALNKRRRNDQRSIANYNNLVSKYTRLHKTYSNLLKQIGSKTTLSSNVRKEIVEQLKLLSEIKTLLSSYTPGLQANGAYAKKYEKCLQEYRQYKGKIAQMNCTKKG